MSIIDIADLKARFENGRQPNANDYIDLIDTLANVAPPTSINFVQYSDYLTNATWLLGGGTKAVNTYTLTRAMFGYSANAKGLYGRLYGIGISGQSIVVLTNDSSKTHYPMVIRPTTAAHEGEFGLWPLTAVGGDFYCKVVTSTAQVQVEVWGEII